MEKELEIAANILSHKSEGKIVKILASNNTQGITSAAIISKTLRKLNKKFCVKILNKLKEKHFKNNGKTIFFLLNLGSNLISKLNELNSQMIIVDNHKIDGKVNEKITLINPRKKEVNNINSPGISYLFSKKIAEKDEELATIAIIGMVDNIDHLNKGIINDANLKIEKGPLIYPATRPIHKTLEFSSSPYIPNVTGNINGVYNLLKKVGIEKEKGKYSNLIELKEEQKSKLLKSIIMKTNIDKEKLIGKIYLTKFLNRQKDAREISSIITTCSKLGKGCTALALCLKNEDARKEAEEIYANYKQKLVSALDYAGKNISIEKNYALLNSKNNIDPKMIEKITSTLADSKEISKDKIVVVMAYLEHKIKISARLINNRNIKTIVEKTMENIEGEYHGNNNEIACLIPKEQEKEFIKNLKNTLKMDVLKVNN